MTVGRKEQRIEERTARPQRPGTAARDSVLL
jgi:hypothetical protein